MDPIEQTEKVAAHAMALHDNRLVDTASSLFAAWLSVAHAEGVPPTVQAAILNSGYLQLNAAIRAYNSKHRPTAH